MTFNEQGQTIAQQMLVGGPAINPSAVARKIVEATTLPNPCDLVLSYADTLALAKGYLAIEDGMEGLTDGCNKYSNALKVIAEHSYSASSAEEAAEWMRETAIDALPPLYQ